MKKIFLLLALFATVFVACSDDDDDNKKEGDNETPWEIKMTVKADADDARFGVNSFSSDAIIESVNWGDGTTSDNCDKLHYYNKGEYTIIIKGKGEIGLNCLSSFSEHAQLISLDVTKCPTLTGLNCSDNLLTSLDLSKNPALIGLSCNNNQLTALDVSKCQALTRLECSYNQLTSLNVSNCTMLQVLGCDGNTLNSLDISKNFELQSLRCPDCQLTSLDVSKNAKLVLLVCAKNNFDDDAMNAIYNGLPVRESSDNAAITILSTDNQGNKTIAKNKNWKVEVLDIPAN